MSPSSIMLCILHPIVSTMTTTMWIHACTSMYIFVLNRESIKPSMYDPLMEHVYIRIVTNVSTGKCLSYMVFVIFSVSISLFYGLANADGSWLMWAHHFLHWHPFRWSWRIKIAVGDPSMLVVANDSRH